MKKYINGEYVDMTEDEITDWLSEQTSPPVPALEDRVAALEDRVAGIADQQEIINIITGEEI